MGEEVAFRRKSGIGRPIRPVIAAFSVVSIVAGVAVAAQIGWFLFRSSEHGAALIRKERGSIAAGSDAGAACHVLPGTGQDGGPQGLLEIPALGLVAPVLQGTSDAVLADAVGHDPASAWPGRPGTAVLSAHDVTWFSSIGGLRQGDVVRYVTPCRTYIYQVTAHDIVAAGSPVYTTAAARIVLDTCYPFNALYLTSTRYLVYASLAEAIPTDPVPAAAPAPPVPAVPVPLPLARQGLGLDENDTPLGTLTLAGTPSPAWRQSSAPFDDETAALTAYFGVIRSAEQARRSWWADLAPSVPAAAAGPLWNGALSGYDTPAEITLRVNGDAMGGASVSAVVTAGPAGPYHLTVDETVRGGDLLVTAVAMRPAP
jgi:sortase A